MQEDDGVTLGANREEKKSKRSVVNDEGWRSEAKRTFLCVGWSLAKMGFWDV